MRSSSRRARPSRRNEQKRVKRKGSLTFCCGPPSPVNRIRLLVALSVDVSNFLLLLLLLLLRPVLRLLLRRRSSGAFRRTTPATELSRIASVMMNVEGAEDPVPGDAIKIHDDHTEKSRRGRIEPAAHTRIHDVAPRDEYRGRNGRARGGEGKDEGWGREEWRRKVTGTRRVRTGLFVTPTRSSWRRARHAQPRGSTAREQRHTDRAIRWEPRERVYAPVKTRLRDACLATARDSRGTTIIDCWRAARLQCCCHLPAALGTSDGRIDKIGVLKSIF